MLNTVNIKIESKDSNDSSDKLDLLYKTKIMNIEKNYNKIKEYFTSIISESNSKLDTYKTIYFQINQVIQFSNKFNKYLYFDDKYRNNVNALVILIIMKEIELEDIRLRILLENNSINNDIISNIKSFIGINLNDAGSLLVKHIYPKLLSILDEAKNSSTNSLV